MSRVIEARAVISAADKTGNVFDRVAAKIKGIEKVAKSFGNMPNFVKSNLGTGSTFGFGEEIKKLAASAKEFEAIRRSIERSYAGFTNQLFKNGPMNAAKSLGAIDLWQKKTLASLRAVQGGYDGVTESHKKFFSHAGRFALHAAGIGGAAYATGHGIREMAKNASERQREAVRYEQMGLTPEEQKEGNSIADTLSAKYPSLKRTEVLADLRKNASRLGGFDRAKEIAEVYAQAKISNKISGGDEHELEQVVRALEGAGKANTAADFRSGLNAWSKAKAANPDYTGEQFRTDQAAAGASKYAANKDYMENVFPILASHTTGFGTKMSTGLSALVGGRATKKSKAALKEAGLLGENGALLDEKGWIANNFEWTQKHVKPVLEKQGVQFGEHMSEEDKSKVVSFATKSFSAKNAADLIITNLIDAALVERARKRKTLDLEAMPELQKKDSGLAYEGAKNQIADLGTALLNLQPVISGLNLFAEKLSGFTNKFDQGSTADKAGAIMGSTALAGGAAVGGVVAAKAAYQWFTGAGALMGSAAALDASAAALTAAAAQLAAGKPLAQVAEKVLGGPASSAAASAAGATGGSIWSKIGTGISTVAPAAGLLGSAMVPAAILGAGIYGAPKLFPDDAESAAKRRAHGKTVRDAYRREFGYDTKTGEEPSDASELKTEDRTKIIVAPPLAPKAPDVGSRDSELLKMLRREYGGADEYGSGERRREHPAPEVSPTMTYGTGVSGDKGPTNVSVTGEVHGEAKMSLEINASSSLISVVERAEQAIKLAGSLSPNGPGSTGKSSPDGHAPARVPSGSNPGF